jgi:hypothetical protein
VPERELEKAVASLRAEIQELSEPLRDKVTAAKKRAKAAAKG